MLEQFNQTVGTALALAALLILLFGPIAGVWLLFSIRRSLARIADAFESVPPFNVRAPQPVHDSTLESNADAQHRIAHSMFAR
jgi:hypothetical protein